VTIKTNKLYGLILTGGKSKRMGTDKGSLNYHGKTQVEHLYELLEGLTDKTFISCREDQANLDHLKSFPKVLDAFDDLGPSGGILSAFKQDPNASWLVLACDMPYLNRESLVHLIKNRDTNQVATCFFNGEKKWPEPLCAIYEPSSVERINHFVNLGKPCPRKVLMNSDVKILEPLQEKVLLNANTLSDLESFKKEKELSHEA
tara:strand:- start:26035 stop:26643 length:609 start_codon:yes stop_codon:yes gene_type:complete